MLSFDILPSPTLAVAGGAADSVVRKVSVPPTGAVEARGLADTNPLNSELIPKRSELAEEVKAGAGAGAGAEESDKPRRSHSRLELVTGGAGLGLVWPGRLRSRH